MALQAQEGRSTLGIVARPVFPLSFFDPITTFDRGPLRGRAELTGGFAFGMSVRAGITKAISLETGINQTTRRYNVSLRNDSVAYSGEDELRFVGYEIPVLALVYIRLGERSWMNTALGFSADIYPTDAQRILEVSRLYYARRGWLLPGVVANIGVELRTYKSGWFYGGFTYHRPFGDMATAEFTWYGSDNLGRTVKARIGGSYLTLDLRYYFHSDPDRPRQRRNDR